MRINVKTDEKGVNLILKGLRLVRVYQEREASWITPEDKIDAKTLTDKIDKAFRNHKDSKVFIDPKCDADSNCDF